MFAGVNRIVRALRPGVGQKILEANHGSEILQQLRVLHND